MPAIFKAELQPFRDLADINREVAQYEQRYGPLATIGNDGSQTILTFAAKPPPTSFAVIAAQNAGNPVIPAGATLVCSGTIFVLGQLTLSAATRV